MFFHYHIAIIVEGHPLAPQQLTLHLGASEGKFRCGTPDPVDNTVTGYLTRSGIVMQRISHNTGGSGASAYHSYLPIGRHLAARYHTYGSVDLFKKAVLLFHISKLGVVGIFKMRIIHRLIG